MQTHKIAVYLCRCFSVMLTFHPWRNTYTRSNVLCIHEIACMQFTLGGKVWVTGFVSIFVFLHLEMCVIQPYGFYVQKAICTRPHKVVSTSECSEAMLDFCLQFTERGIVNCESISSQTNTELVNRGQVLFASETRQFTQYFSIPLHQPNINFNRCRQSPIERSQVISALFILNLFVSWSFVLIHPVFPDPASFSQFSHCFIGLNSIESEDHGVLLLSPENCCLCRLSNSPIISRFKLFGRCYHIRWYQFFLDVIVTTDSKP